MPISSHQVGGFIGGQQAMFGNFASYATQISPMGQMGGPPPTYQNPMGGNTGMEAPPPPGDPAFGMPGYNNIGASVMSGVGNVGLPAAAGAMMLGGAFMPGPVGGFFRGIDPFSRGLSAFGKGVGWQGGGMAGLGGNLSRMAGMGVGGIARAGLMGLGSAAMTALPLMAAGGALKYGIGQMVEGAQFENQVGGFLQNQFRFQNPRSESGYGFGRREQGDIANLLREMGTQEMMSTPQEMLRVMKQGVGMGLMTAVQDAKTFKAKFKEMVGVAKEIATAMQTTIEGAMPFMREARQMGFWTPQDIMRQAGQTRATAATTGLSVAQTQQMMSQGAQMARSIGAQGRYGAIGMERTLNMVGGAVRSGVLSEQQLSEITGGLQGPEAVAAMSQSLMQATTRFAASNRGRWAIAGLANRNMQGFDPARMQQFLAGGMSIGQIGNLARQNVGGGNAFNFVMNEERLRGQLMAAGPEAQAGFMRAQLGDRLFGGSARDQYITRRVIQRYTGFGGEQADAFAKMLRQAPQIFEENARRTQAQADQGARDREMVMNQSWEGMKRQIGKWWDMTVSDPLQKMGAQVSRSINETVARAGDWLFNRTASRNRIGALTAAEGQSLERFAMGDTQAARIQFGPGGGMGLTGRGQVTIPGMWGMTTVPISGQAMEMRAAAGGGALTQRAAEGMGFRDVKSAEAGLSAAREKMGEFLNSKAVRQLQQETLLQGREWTMELARKVRSGAIAAPKEITALVRGAGNRYGAGAAALAAAQTQEQRGWATGGLTLRGEGETESWGLDERSVERNMEQAEKGLTEAFGGKRRGFFERLGRAYRAGKLTDEDFYRADQGAFKPEDIGELRGLAGGKFEQAAKLVATAQQLEQKPDASKADREEAARLKARSKAMLGELRQTDAKDKPHLTELLDRMMDADDKTYMTSMGKMGSALQQKAASSYGKTVQRRMERFATSLTEEGVAALTKKLEGMTGQHGAIMKERITSLMKKEGASLDYRQRMGMLEELAGAAGMDPAKTAEILALTEGTEGGEDIRAALKGGMMAGGLAEQITGKGRGRVGATQQFLTQLMPGVSGKDLTGEVIRQALSGNQAAIGKILKKTDASSQKQVEEFFELAKQGTPEARAKIMAMGRRGASAMAARMLHGERSLTQEVESGLKLKEGTDMPRFGQGGIDGVYKTLTAQIPLMQNMEKGIAIIAGSVKGGEKFSSVQQEKK